MANWVYVVDDDMYVRGSIAFLLKTLGLNCAVFSGGDEFLAVASDLEPGCILLDYLMPGLNGDKVQEKLISSGYDWPVVFMTGSTDVPMVVRAVKSGAIEVVMKPFSDECLLKALHLAFVKLRDRLPSASAPISHEFAD